MSVLGTAENTPSAWSTRADTSPSPAAACGWSERSQEARLRAVVAALQPAAGDSLLDWGSGTGELCRYIDDEVGYVGFDTATGMVVRAAREHPGHHFQTWEPTHSFDLVAAVGPFNLPGQWSKEMTWATLRRLWERTGRAMCVSLYAGDDPACLTYTEVECARFARGSTYHWQVVRWRPNDILILLQRGPRKRVF